MIVQEAQVTRRIMQEAHSLVGAGHDVSILTRSEDTSDGVGETQGIPTEWVAVKGRDSRFRWLYKLAGVTRGSQAAAFWSALTLRHTFTRRVLPRAIATRADVYHAHDLNNVPVAYGAARANNARFVYDAHELFTEIGNPWIKIRKNGWERLEREIMPHAALNITVNEFIAEELAKRNRVAPPLVVYNCPDPPGDFDPGGRYDLIRQRLGLGESYKVVVYHGWVAPGRGLEDLVRSVRYLDDNVAVVIIGHTTYPHTDAPNSYRVALRELGEREAPGRVFILPPLPFVELLPFVASADVGMIPIQGTDLNYYYTSPNRLFDFIQAAVPIVASDLPFLRKMVAGNNLGVVAKLDSPRSYAEAINGILARPDQGEEYRANLRRIAPQYTWEAQAKKLIAAYSKLS